MHILRWLRSRYFKWTERRVRIPVRRDIGTERPGSKYGGWIIPENCLHRHSVCYLVGAGLDVSFDLALANRYGCTVHIFDPTPQSLLHLETLRTRIKKGELTPCPTCEGGYYPSYPADIAARLQIHPFGIWHEDTTMRFYSPENEEFISHSLVNLQQTDRHIDVEVKSLPTILHELGHSRINLLKLDIEGAEYQVLDSMLEHGIQVDILCVEYDESHRHHLDGRYIDRIEASLQALCEAGYEVVAREPDCHNYTLMHQKTLLS